MARDTVRIKVLSNIAGRPAWSREDIFSGWIGDAPLEVAKAWVEDGLAAYVREDKPEKA